ncbi:glycoside hydrolase family 15 protein [Rhodovibrio sodomensis]|nr:glycoside hydrolase family 15 protein [Rhodovibrio sodomensis]
MTLRAGEQAAFLLTDAAVEPPVPCDPHALAGERDGTTAFWRAWLGQIVYRGRWQESVRRSALVLKLLTSRRHGAIAAAGTFGLPEAIGGGRNWDYRYCWIRDSAFSVYAFLRLGFTDEAHAYMDWIQGRFRDCGHCGTLDVLYTLDGRGEPNETELTHLEGYRGSRPVRVGNAAHAQLQLDIYGELLDALYLADKHVHPVPHDTWVNVQRAVEHVAANWQRSDAGIWEVRGGPRAFLHSRLMCWVALDRGLRLATRESLPAPVDRWRAVRDEIYESIFCEFWDPRLGAFVQSAGSKTVDAAALMMPLVRFISPVDPKWLSTLDVIGWRLANDALLHRYDDTEPEGLDGSQEGHFTMCSFWYVECLARAGRVDEAHLLFDKMLSYANHLGLFAEELGIDGCHLGNFPQAFTHLALISAASALERFGGEPMP